MSEAKKLVESLQTDLRSLSNEAKKKHNSVKDASEAAMVKVRNITDGATESNLISRLRQASNELLHPFVMGCASKNPRLVQISLAGVQRLVQHRAVETNVVPAIVQELWSLMEAECEELRVLQTLSLIVSTDHLVSGPSLAKCLVMCFRLNFAKDPIVINTASASVRQLIDLVFERIVKEDGLNANGNGQSQTQPEAAKTSAPPRLPPATLKPAAADGYMLFRDLCLLLNAEQPSWLIGIQEMTRTLGLELLESVLSGYPSIFANHQEFVFLLKEQVCPLVIKLFSPNLKYLQVASQHPHSRQTADAPSSDRQQDRPYFPIAMRLLRVVCVLITRFYDLLVTECEIFLTLILKFMESDKLPWQRGLALETLHRITAKPDLLRSFCISYDLKPHSAKVLQSIVSGLAGFVQASFLKPESHNQSSKEEDGSDGNGQAIGQPGFLYRGIWIPLCFISAQGSPKTLLLELLDKHEPPLLSDGYCLSLAYGGMVDACQSLYQAIENEGAAAYKSELSQALFNSSHSSILATLSLLLDASIDESITETLLKCLSTLVGLSCRLEQPGARDATLGALCKASLPPNYLVRVLGAHSGSSPVDSPRSGKIDAFESDATAGHPNQVVAVGTACPTPALSSQLLSAPVMLTSKNLQSTRSLIATAQINGPQLNESWHLVLASVQHLVWILGMKPSPSGGFRTGGESGDATTVLTTAVMADVPVMASMLNKLFDMTAELDDVGLHHVIAALCKLSSESMRVAQNQREPSFFPVAKLLQTGWANLKRLPVFWKPLTAHLIEVSSVSFAKLREWGATALTMLVRQALVENIDLDEVKRQQMVLAPLLDVCEIEFADVRQKQIDCLMQIIQSRGQQLKPELWPTVITIVGSVVSGQFSFDEALIKQSYQAVNLMVTDFLETLSLRCVQMLVETDAKFGVQQKELNISLSAVGQLWTISDFLRRKGPQLSAEESENLWLVLYNCLSELCVDSRPPVRKSACQTLLQTVAAHGAALKPSTWKHMVWKILFPMMDKVRALTGSASTTRSDSGALGASNILIHHSRDTESKQWAETSVQTLAGVVKIFNAQRSVLISLSDFPSAWSTLMGYIEPSAASDNAEMSLAALKSFQELLHGRTSPQTLDINTRDRASSTAGGAGSHGDDLLPNLPEELWLVAWQTWVRIASALIAPRPQATLESPAPIQSVVTKEPRPAKVLLPGPSHLTTLLHTFPQLFDHVKNRIAVEEVKYAGVLTIIKGIVAVPVSTDQAPFILPTAADVTPTQEAVLDCIKTLYEEMVASNSNLREALPDLYRLLLDLVGYSVRTPPSPFLAGKKDCAQWVMQNSIPFAELSLRTLVEYYSNTAHYAEIVQATVLVDIVKCLSVPMSLKYQCPAQTTWKAAASAFITVIRLGLPIARQQVRHFRALWTELADAFEKFLFTSSKPSTPLSSDERKRHEFVDCQMIDLIRAEILPFINIFPRDFTQRIVELLNKGSINSTDHKDVLALDTYLQRTELSRVSFEALLSMSQSEPDLVRCTSPSNSDKPIVHLGTSAINSLISRCRQVMTSYVNDEATSGEMRLPQERVVEMASVLNAVVTLIDGLTKRGAAPVASNAHNDVWLELIELYPTLVDCVPSCKSDRRVEDAVVEALKAYKSLLKRP